MANAHRVSVRGDEKVLEELVVLAVQPCEGAERH